MEYKNSATLQVREIKKALGPRLNKIGVIKTGDAWHLCKQCPICSNWKMPDMLTT